MLRAVGLRDEIEFLASRYDVECHFGMTFVALATKHTGCECRFTEQCFTIEEANALDEVIRIVRMAPLLYVTVLVLCNALNSIQSLT